MQLDPVDRARFYLQGLASLHLRRPAPPEDVAWVLRQAPPVEWAAGEEVFAMGSAADTAVLVVSGELVATVPAPDGERVVGSSGPWEMVGETALFAPDRPRSATVRARRDSVGLRIAPSLLAAGRENAVVAALEYLLLHTLSQRIRSTNAAIHAAWKELDGAAEGSTEAPTLPAGAPR